MNSSKVRIYELSRELNLENKDILAICERLNIAVKSHSSTITEDEASRIRTAAASYAADTSGAPQKPLTATPPTSQPTDNHKGSKRPVRKQQILEIRRPAVAPEAPRSPEARPPQPQKNDDSPAATDQLLTPPSRPTSPTRPSPAVSPVSKTTPQEDAQRPAERLSAPPVEPGVGSPQEADLPAVAKQKLTSPPVRPRPPKPRDTVVPILGAPERRRPESAAQSQSASEAAAPVARVTLKPKPVIELKRPKAASTTTTEPEEETFTGAEVDVLGEDRKPDLRRLSPPRPPKRKAHEEEEDDQDMRQKAKVPGKVKRRSQTVLEDDEDFEDADGTGAGGNAAPQVSLSLMRPPKPKSRQTQPKPAMIKSRTLSRGGSSRSQRRERREAVKPEKPELITLTGSLTVHELAQQIVVPETEIIKSLFFKGIAANINQTLDVPTAKMVAEEFEIEVETAELESEAKKVTEMLDESDLESLQSRPPVVTIMGHVDHGKTTLLDSIRKAKVAQGEAGGITQHIGAYHVDVEHAGQERQVVFLDTPGHEAFTAMRARGARVTDIAVLVVAADDGVRPQTIEAISHAQAAKVPIVVAINKIDKETANPDRVKQELMEYGLVPEEWGGEAVMVPVSAISGENLDTLLEMLLLVAEVEDLHANPDRLARGTVIEANLDKARGPVATLLIQNGTLRVGDSLVAGAVFGKVRAMIDDRSERVDAASPSFAVEVLGLSDVPQAGDEFEVYAEEKEARSVADKRAAEQRQSRLQQAMASRRVTLTSLSAQAQEGDLKELNLILKADVQGSVEAILAALQQLPQKEVQIRVLMAAPGEISETDVDLAAASSAVIVGFNTTLAPGARQAGDRLGVDIRDYDIIYKLLEDIEGAMEGLLEPEQVEEPLGEVEVRAVFPVRRGTVAGSYVLSGKVTRNCRIRVMRGGEQVYEGNLDSLKRMKEDAKEVNAGFECGIGVDNFNNWKEGDRIEAFRFTTKRRSLSHS